MNEKANDKCPKCGGAVYRKYASKAACKIVEALSGGRVNAEELYFGLPSGPILTDSHRHGALHDCTKREKTDRKGVTHDG